MAMPFGKCDTNVDLEQESEQLIATSLEAQGCRELAASYVAAAGIQLAPTIDDKLLLSSHSREELHHFELIAELYERTIGRDLLEVVDQRARALPTPANWAESCVALFLFDRACTTHLYNHRGSTFQPLALLAKMMVAEEEAHAASTAAGLRDVCTSAKGTEEAQACVETWLRIAVSALGNPESTRDWRSVELGLKACDARTLSADYVKKVAPLLRDCGLTVAQEAHHLRM